MTALDALLTYILGTVLLTVIVNSIAKNLAVSIFIAVLLVILFRAVFLHIFNRKRNKSVISVAEMENEFSLMAGEQTDFLFARVPSAFNPEKCDGGFTYTEKGRKILVAANYKFSSTGADDVAKFYRVAKKVKADSVTVLGRAPSRSVLVFAAGLDVRFTFLRSARLHKFLLSQNALMPKRRKIKNPKKPSFKTLFSDVLSKKRGKYFLICGLSLSVFAFFGTMRVYYFVFCALCFALAIGCFLRKT